MNRHSKIYKELSARGPGAYELVEDDLWVWTGSKMLGSRLEKYEADSRFLTLLRVMAIAGVSLETVKKNNPKE
jgi:hypothetical protein